MRRIAMIFVMILGSFAVYCGQGIYGNGGEGGRRDGRFSADAARSGDAGFLGEGGFVRDAAAGTCSSCSHAFTKIAEGDVSCSCGGTSVASPAIPVGAYQNVVLYISNANGGIDLSVLFRPDAATGFGDTGQDPAHLVQGGVYRVDGSDMELQAACNVAGSTFHYVVAGVQ